MGRAYLDNHTVLPPKENSLKALAHFAKEHWGVWGTGHEKGELLCKPTFQSLERISSLLGLDEEDQFILTHSSAEAINQVHLSTYLETIRDTGRTHLLTTAAEEAPILQSIKRLESFGCSGKFIPLSSEGMLTPKALKEAIKPRSVMLSISWVNALTGIVQPIEELASICKENDLLLHVDASCATGRLFFQLSELPIDFLTIEGSLIGAPLGSGALIVKGGHSVSELVLGNKPSATSHLVAFQKALEEHLTQLDHFSMESARLRDHFEKQITKRLDRAHLLFKEANRLPNVSCIAFEGVSSEALLFLLHQAGVQATRGGGRMQKLSSLLRACGIQEQFAKSAVSFALSSETTDEEIDYAVEQIVASINNLRLLSEKLPERLQCI